jgi:hypothetical protein
MRAGDYQRLDLSHRGASAKLVHGDAGGHRAAGVIAEIRNEREAVRRDSREDQRHDQKPPHPRSRGMSIDRVVLLSDDAASRRHGSYGPRVPPGDGLDDEDR